MVFSNKIKEIRRILQLNQTEFAERLGVSRSIVSEFENDTREPSKEFIIALSKLGISLDWFLTGNGNIFIEANKVASDYADIAHRQANKVASSYADAEHPQANKLASNRVNNLTSTTGQENLPIQESLKSFTLESTAPRFAELEEKISTQNEKLNNLQAQIDELKGAVEKKQIEEAYNSPPAYTPDPKLRPYSDLHVAEPQINYGLKKELSEPEETEDLPLAENLAAGIPVEAFDSGETYPVPKKFLKRGKKYCVAKIKGTSMTEAGIVDGSFVLLEYTDTALSGEIMVVKYGEQTTLKRLSQKEDGSWELLYEDGSGAVIPLKDGDWEVKGHYVRVVN